MRYLFMCEIRDNDNNNDNNNNNNNNNDSWKICRDTNICIYY